MKLSGILSRIASAPASAAERVDELSMRARLGVQPVSLPRRAWLVPALIVVFAGILRFYHLAYPNAIVFDETYYAKDAYSYLHYGYELQWSEDANKSFESGHPTGIKTDAGERVVHPPVGKWMIAAGMALFGDNNPFGWRFSAALVGTLAVALLVYAGWLLFRSLTVASIAGILGAVDGLMLVESRLALLDIFQMFWLLATFVCLLLDRRSSRLALIHRLAHPPAKEGGYFLSLVSLRPDAGWRLWRLAAGVCAGLAVGVKWNSLFFVAIFGILTVLWDMNARRVLGMKYWALTSTVRDAIPAFIQIIGVGLVVYVSTWAGWFASSDAYFRQGHPLEPTKPINSWFPVSLQSLWEYHVDSYKFHSELGSPHPYASPAWQWLILGRPTSYYYESYTQGNAGCTVQSCSAQIINIGNPLIWWSAIALVVVALFIVVRRTITTRCIDWRFASLLLIFGAGYLPWFLYPERTMFFFYALSFEPFMLLIIAGVLGAVLGHSTSPIWRQRLGLIVTGSYLVLVLLVSAYYWPLWTGQTLPYEQWYSHMWFQGWI